MEKKNFVGNVLSSLKEEHFFATLWSDSSWLFTNALFSQLRTATASPQPA